MLVSQVSEDGEIGLPEATRRPVRRDEISTKRPSEVVYSRSNVRVNFSTRSRPRVVPCARSKLRAPVRPKRLQIAKTQFGSHGKKQSSRSSNCWTRDSTRVG